MVNWYCMEKGIFSVCAVIIAGVVYRRNMQKGDFIIILALGLHVTM